MCKITNFLGYTVNNFSSSINFFENVSRFYLHSQKNKNCDDTLILNVILKMWRMPIFIRHLCVKQKLLFDIAVLTHF